MLKTYDSKSVVVTIAGFIISGFSEGSMVKAERNEDTFKLVVGADGEGTRSRSNNKSGKITISLLQTSESNDILSGFALYDETSNSGVFPILIKDLSGTSLHGALNAWITKPPSASYEKEAKDREWVIETEDLSWFVGQTVDQQTILASVMKVL